MVHDINQFKKGKELKSGCYFCRKFVNCKCSSPMGNLKSFPFNKIPRECIDKEYYKPK